MFGSRFKKLRIAQNISLQQAAHNVINPSSLSRWENNQNELRFDIVIELLNNIHISPLEFLSITVITPHTPVIEEVNSAQDSPLELKRLASKYLTIYEDSKNKHDLFSAAIVCNFYYEVSNKNMRFLIKTSFLRNIKKFFKKHCQIPFIGVITMFLFSEIPCIF